MYGIILAIDYFLQYYDLHKHIFAHLNSLSELFGLIKNSLVNVIFLLWAIKPFSPGYPN